MPSPVNPFIVYGVVSDANATVVASVNVIAHNTTTGERTERVLTNTSGQYVIDLANLASGYTAGDSITVYCRNAGYTGEQTFTISGENANKNITVNNQVTFATLENNLWVAIKNTLKAGTFAISETSIFSAMNDELLSSEGYPIVVMHRPLGDFDPINMTNNIFKSELVFRFEVYATSDENCKILTDNIRNQLFRAQEVWDGLNITGLRVVQVDNDWYVVGKKKIHIKIFNAIWKWGGQVTVP